MSFCFQQGSGAFQWTSNVSKTIYKCPNDDVILPWNYVTTESESVMGVFWHTDNNGTIASYVNDHFLSSSSRVGNLSSSNAGLVVKGLRRDDAGIFGVNVMLTTSSKPFEQENNVVVLREYFGD